jgi:hypothetical protein
VNRALDVEGGPELILDLDESGRMIGLEILE